MGCEIPRAYRRPLGVALAQCVGAFLAVEEDKIDAEWRGRQRAERTRGFKQHGDAGSGIVGPWHRIVWLFGVAISPDDAVIMGGYYDAPRVFWVEAGDEVRQLDRVSGGSFVTPTLRFDRFRRGFCEFRFDIRKGLLM